MPTHKKPESERYRGPGKYCLYLLGRSLISLLQAVPIGLAHRMGRAFGWLAWQVMARRRAVVRRNLAIVNDWLKADETRVRDRAAFALPIDAQVKEVFQRAGGNLFSGFTFSRMSPAQIREHLELDGVDLLKSALQQGRGVVVVLAHMGPWEALAQLPGLGRQEGVEAPFGALYRPLNNRYLDDWYCRQREARGTRLFSRRDGFHKPVDFLRSGGMLGVLSDQRLKRGEAVPFFGVSTKTTPIPGLLQRRSRAAVLGVSIATVATTRWRMCFHRVELEGLDQRSRDIDARRCNAALEAMLSRSPLDGFWFHERYERK
jgi:KDO2-lipid IV(A) lauroyltransferase